MARRRGNGQRMQKRWTTLLGLTDVTVAAGTFFASGILTFDEAQTILRVRAGDLLVQMRPNAGGDVAEVTFGLGVVSADAAAVGAGSLPDPSAEPEYPWLWWRSINLVAFGTTNTSTMGAQVERVVLDTQAMRKVKPREALVLVGEFTQVAGTPALDFSGGPWRVLVGE